ncbi:MAG: hypothetical protein ABIS36_11240 [Chryseolinea sp.]
MRIDLFWKSWINEYRWLWYMLVALLAFFVLFLWFEDFQGPSGITEWMKLQEQKSIETMVHSFQLGPFNLSVPGDSYVILEYLHGSNVEPNTIASYIFLFGLIGGVTVLLCIITTLEKYWYYGGMGLFIVLMVSLRLEVIGLFGHFNKIPGGVVTGLYVIISFYINRFKSDTTFIKRLSTFLLLDLLVGLSIHFFAHVDYPFLHLALTGYSAGMIISVLFIILIAHEIIAAMIAVVSSGSTHSLRHFAIIAAIYMTNIIITCFHEIGYIHWTFIYVNLYLLLTCSTLLGIWGFRQRESQYSHILPFSPFGAFAFLSLATICFATTGQLLGNWNDPALKIIRDALIFSHTGYGAIFLVYIFSNFVYLLARNLQVQKVLYNPTRMPYFTYRFAGMIAMLGFIFYSGWRGYIYQGMAGFYNTTGDLYSLLGNEEYAESFYDQAALQAFRNNRSNYSLATLRSARMDFDQAHRDYEKANAYHPTPYSLANSGNLYIWEGKVDDAINTFRQGERQIKGSGVLENNLGFAFTKKNQLDSAIFYLNRARMHSTTSLSAEINFFALTAMQKIPIKIDSIIEVFKTSATPVLANAVALSTVIKQDWKVPIDPIPDGRLNLYTATLLNNYLIKNAATVDTAFIARANKIISDSLNNDFSEQLKSALAFSYYLRGNVAQALTTLAELVYISQENKGKYNYVMGLWTLEQRNPELASSYFTYADTYDYKDARFYNAIALSESGKVLEAAIAWDSVALHHRGELQAIAVQMKKILTLPITATTSLNDNEKYQFARYRIGLKDSVAMDQLLNQMEDTNFKAQSILDFSKRYYDADLLPPAIRYFQRIGGLELTNKELYEDVRHFELLMLATQRDLKGLADQINNGIIFREGSLEKNLYGGLIASFNGDTTTARKNFVVLSKFNPYQEEGIIASADFYRKNDKDKLKAYSILAEAIQINSNSIRLMKAFANEAIRVGFDDYAASAEEKIQMLQAAIH